MRCWLTVWDPDLQKVRYFINKVFPFGAAGAVICSNRLARALSDMMRKLLFLPVVNYVGDFPHLDVKSAACKLQVVMEEFLDILS